MSSCWHYEIRKWLGGVGCVFFHFTIEGERSGVASCNLRTCLSLLGSEQVAVFWGVCTSCNLVCLLRVADLLSLTSYVTRHRHMSNHSYVIERTMQSLSLLREGGLRNDAAGAALWRTRPYECAIDVCQLLTMVIADVCRVEFSSLLICNEWRICSI